LVNTTGDAFTIVKGTSCNAFEVGLDRIPSLFVLLLGVMAATYLCSVIQAVIKWLDACHGSPETVKSAYAHKMGG